jgi:hypothetical protein
MLPSAVLNLTIALHLAHTVAVFHARASLNNTASSFTACSMTGTAFCPISLSLCVNILVSSSNILLQSMSRLSDSAKQLTKSSSSLGSSSELLLSPLGVAARSGIGVPILLVSLGCSWVVLALILGGADSILLAAFPCVLAGWYWHLTPCALTGSYWHLSWWECGCHCQIHSWPSP